MHSGHSYQLHKTRGAPDAGHDHVDKPAHMEISVLHIIYSDEFIKLCIICKKKKT